VVGGALRYTLQDERRIPADTPATVYPDSSFFCEVPRKGADGTDI
jgi:hypothetical protein